MFVIKTATILLRSGCLRRIVETQIQLEFGEIEASICWNFSAEISNSIQCEKNMRYARWLQNDIFPANAAYYHNYYCYHHTFYRVSYRQLVDIKIIPMKKRTYHLAFETFANDDDGNNIVGGNEMAINITKCFRNSFTL